jgi:hypothetical protein
MKKSIFLSLQKVGRQLKSERFRSNYKKIFRLTYLWLLPLAIAAAILTFVRPAAADLLNYEARLSQYLLENDLTVGVQANDDGFPQVFYEFENTRTYITDNRFTNGQVYTKGEYITWMSEIDGLWQIFMHHVPTNITTQLSYSGNNANPKVSGGYAVWEGYVDSLWQIFVYDGTSVRQITQGDLSINPDIENHFVVLASRDGEHEWRTVGYYITDNLIADIANDTGSYVKLNGLNVDYGSSEKDKRRHPLTIEEVFIVEFGQISPFITNLEEPQQVEFEYVRDELEMIVREAEELQ